LRLSSSAALSAANADRTCVKGGKTVLAISHDDHYFEHADRLLEMRSGKLNELHGEARAGVSRDAVAQIGNERKGSRE